MNQAELEQLLASYPEMLTVSEVATVLRVHPRSIQRWSHEGHVSSIRVGRSYRIPRTDVLRWLLAASLPSTGVSNTVAQREIVHDAEETAL